ncbi:LAMI_0G05820g1_1 [Lachancea mirantina]|uniref:pH-response regulator protein palF/RIM8 n=1 Tax=Lachancea mirantina TaxID=1230905 RepID=A0A1G4K936_9SACH|nr:LAMI_0G05820g1_1 [Lachancea mirantina]
MGLLTRLKVNTGKKKDDGDQKQESVSTSILRLRGSSKFRRGTPPRDFYVELDEPHTVWKPNDYVSGQVVLVLKEDVLNVAVSLALVGELRVKTGITATNKLRFSERLFEKIKTIYGREEVENQALDQGKVVNGLTKGEHRFPFRLRVPSKNIFTSISFERGSVSYDITCDLKSLQPDPHDKILAHCQKRISIMVPVDVAPMPKPNTKTIVLQSPSTLKQPRHQSSENEVTSTNTRRTSGSLPSSSTMGTSGSLKTVTISADIPATGFVMGEIIPIKLRLEHYKEYAHSAGIIATLVRICRVGGAGHLKEIPFETYRKDICQTVAPICVDSQTHEFCSTLSLKVPSDAFPTLVLPNRQFSFQYYVEILVNLSKKNLVYTESNRLIDTGLNSEMFNSGKTGDVITALRREITSVTMTGAGANKCNDEESMIFYKDLINVDKLKRLRNVAGMSIEVVIGTKRSELPSQEPLNEREQTEQTDFTETQGVQNYTDYLFPNISSFEVPKGKDGDIPAEAMYFPLPEYTPNAEIHVVHDKDELEQMRLREKESEPAFYN